MASNVGAVNIEVPEGRVMGEEVVNLDLPPKDRWTEIGNKYSKIIQEQVAKLKECIPEYRIQLVEILGSLLEWLLPAPYGEELRGLAAATDVPVGDLFFMNIAYDLTAHCTGIVAQGEDGRILQARNLDTPKGLLPFSLDTSTFMTNFQRDGKTAYRCVIIAGMIGTATGVKPNSFTINLNVRRTGSVWDTFIKRDLSHPGSGIVFLIRDALADPDINYQGVLNRMMYIPMISSSYIIIAGTQPGEGAVISRDRKEAVKPFSNGVWKLDNLVGSWYLLQTNNDHWTHPPDLEPVTKGDDDGIEYSYKRSEVGNEAMKKMGQQNLSPQGLMDVLSTSPVYNNCTLYTTMMSASEPSLNQSWFRNIKN